MKITNAMKADRSEEMGLEKKKHRRCSKCRDRQSKIKLNRYRETDQYPDGRKPVLPYSLEEELVSYCHMMERKFFGLTTRSIKRMTLDLAIKMVLPVHCQ